MKPSNKKLTERQFNEILAKETNPKERKKMLRERCRTDLGYFAKHFFPQLCRLPWSKLHTYLFASSKESVGEFRLG